MCWLRAAAERARTRRTEVRARVEDGHRRAVELDAAVAEVVVNATRDIGRARGYAERDIVVRPRRAP